MNVHAKYSISKNSISNPFIKSYNIQTKRTKFTNKQISKTNQWHYNLHLKNDSFQIFSTLEFEKDTM